MPWSKHRDICNIPIQVGDYVLFTGAFKQVLELNEGSSFSILRDFDTGYNTVGVNNACLKLTSEQVSHLIDKGD